MDTAELYEHWAAAEAHGSSPTYEQLALAIARDDWTRTMLETLPPAKRQPNLLFGAIRWHAGPVEDPDECLRWLRGHQQEVLATMAERRTQTNEIGRCALLLPVLAQLPEPLALIEVGASAGLCLLYDAWRYRYTNEGTDTYVGDSALTLTCETSGPVPMPPRIPEISWRAGLDLNPLNPADEEVRRWLSCLVWPEHHDRAAALRAALHVACERQVPVHQGDLLADLPTLLDQAPADATVVVLHTATLAYVPPQVRQSFVALLRERGVHRVGAEGVGVLPDISRRIPESLLSDREFIVSLDDEPMAFAHPHGRSLRWLPTVVAS
jgi:hypothetical protein